MKAVRWLFRTVHIKRDGDKIPEEFVRELGGVRDNHQRVSAGHYLCVQTFSTRPIFWNSQGKIYAPGLTQERRLLTLS